MKKRYLTPEQAAAELELSTDTLERWRKRQYGPPWRQHGTRVRYVREEVQAWDLSTRRGGVA